MLNLISSWTELCRQRVIIQMGMLKKLSLLYPSVLCLSSVWPFTFLLGEKSIPLLHKISPNVCILKFCTLLEGFLALSEKQKNVCSQHFFCIWNSHSTPINAVQILYAYGGRVDMSIAGHQCEHAVSRQSEKYGPRHACQTLDENLFLTQSQLVF